MKFAILTDIHLGPEGYYKGVLRKINKDAKVFLNNFITEMNDNVNPDFVVVLGRKWCQEPFSDIIFIWEELYV